MIKTTTKQEDLPMMKEAYCVNVINAKRSKPEKSSTMSLVENITVKGMSDKILNAQLSGQLIKAQEAQFDFMNDEQLPKKFEMFNFQDIRKMDIVDKMEFVAYTEERMRQKQMELKDANDIKDTEKPEPKKTVEKDIEQVQKETKEPIKE